MKTPSTLHVQNCSVPGCLGDALITVAFGEQRFNPKGYCREHLQVYADKQHIRQAEDELLNDVLTSLGLEAA
jgi:hypothetical protein